MQNKLVETDELLKHLYDPDQIVQESLNRHRKKKKKQSMILRGIVILAVLHLLYLGIPMVLGVNHTVDFFGSARVMGIPYFEGTDLERPGKVVVVGKYDIDQMNVGDHVMVYGLLDTEYYWELEIQSYDNQSKTFIASYNGVTENNYEYDDIVGSFVREANFFGFISYVSSQWRSFLAITVIYTSAIVVYHILIVRELKVIERKTVDE